MTSKKNGSVPSVSIIIRCFNEQKHIGKLLFGIKTQHFDGDVEVLVVDSGSTDDTVAIAGKHGAKIVSIAPEEFSFGRALNMGCAAASGELLVFASAHVYPLYDDWLATLTKPFRSEKTALCYGRQRGGDGTKFSEEQVFRQWFPETSTAVQETPFCNNANCAIRRDLWKRFPYDEMLTGLEDIDWARRVQKDGYHIAYSAEAAVAHIHEESFRQTLNRYRREAIALKRIDPEQNMTLWDYSSLLMKNILSDYVRAIRNGCLSENFVQIPAFRAAQLTGALWGFRRGGTVSSALKRTFYYPRGVRPVRNPERGDRRPIDYTGGFS